MLLTIQDFWLIKLYRRKTYSSIGILKGITMTQIIEEIIQIMKLEHHYNLTAFSDDFLQKTIQRRSEILGFVVLADYIQYFKVHTDEPPLLWHSLYISYSQFFRDSHVFSILEHTVIPSIVANKSEQSEIRVWSAGCAFGQETYSIAMLLCSSEEIAAKKIKIRIIGTDISEAAILRARNGLYSAEELQNVKISQLNAFFVQIIDGYYVSDKLKKHIIFSVHDLLNPNYAYPPESIYGDFDIVMCGNILFYYAPDYQKMIVGNLVKSLSKNGYLITTDAETEIVSRSNRIRIQNYTLPIFRNI